MISYFKSRLDSLLLWCNEHLIGYGLVYFEAIAVLIVSTPLLYVLWKKPGYYRKVFDEITSKETIHTTTGHKIYNIIFTVLFSCCFCVCIASWIGFIIYTLLFLGL